MSHAYWRILITYSGTNTCSVAELKFYDSTGTQIATTGGTPSASSDFGSGFQASEAFDGNINTFWNAAHTPSSGSPEWLRYQFASAVDVASCSITARNDSNYVQSPQNFSLQYSDDGSTWTTLYQYNGVPWFSDGQSHTFTSSNAVQALGTGWRILITASGTNTCSIAELKFYDASETEIATGGYSAFSSSVFSGAFSPAAGAAFDGDATTFWDSSGTPSTRSPEWLGYQFSSAVAVSCISIQARNNDFTQAPQAFSLQSTTDGITWTTVRSYTATWSSIGQTQTFCPPSTVGPQLYVIT